jgi:predicted AlkP superfamily pyrophosphatase or phosphodiesterase
MTSVRRGLLLITVVVALLLVAAGSAFAAQKQKPTRVIIVTMDQMKPGYVKQYNMKYMRWLQNRGAHFKSAHVGQLASETVVSHNSIVSGQFPKHMGWSDEVVRDVDDVLGYGKGAIVTVGDLTYDQYEQLIDAGDYPKLGDYMHVAFPGSVVASFGEKQYQVESTAASSSDYWAFMGGKKAVADLPAGTVPWTGKYRGPAGNVPSYIASDPRFLISSGNAADKYGTDVDEPAWLYPEDGRHVPGIYEDHASGDNWVADCAIRFMEEEDDWSAMHLNFSGIDKIGHMWGGGSIDKMGWDPDSVMAQVHMPWIAKNADDQLGRVIKSLKALGQWNETLFVVLADHGVTYGENWYGLEGAGAAYDAWYNDPTGLCANTDYGRVNVNPVLKPLNDTGNIAYSYQSAMIEAWLIDQGWGKRIEAARAMRTMPGVIATYVRWGERYVLVAKGKMTKAERSWWASRGQRLVDTMAFDGAADVIGLLGDRTLYAAFGDHGGAQKDCQRVPMVMYAKGMKHKVSRAQFRLVDVMPTVLRAMGIKRMAPMDGKAYRLPL